MAHPPDTVKAPWPPAAQGFDSSIYIAGSSLAQVPYLTLPLLYLDRIK
jgi:hypothetical protein